MGHHINKDGRFQSDKHPELPPDRIRLNFENPRSWRALAALADDYEDVDPELAADIHERLKALGHGKSPDRYSPALRERARTTVSLILQLVDQGDFPEARATMLRAIAGVRE